MMTPTDVEKISEKNLMLYLLEKESRDGYERYLDLTISLSGAKPWDWQSITLDEWTQRKQVELTAAEAQELSGLEKEDMTGKLFAKFGITDLRSYPGYPKGPYYSVCDGVYETIRRRQ